MSPAMQIIIMIGLLLAVPATCALVLRRAGAPGWPVLGGVLAGVLLGPTILGRVAPQAHESIFIGGIQQREALDRLHSRQGADLLAAEAAGFDAAAFEQLRRTHVQERAPLEEDLHAARWAHQRPLRVFTVLIAITAFLGASRFAITRPPQPQHIVSALNIGLWAALFPGACAYLAATRWWGWSAPESAIIAATVMIGPWALTRIDREAADRAEHGGAHLMQSAGRVATIVALGAAAWGFFAMMGVAGLAWCAAIGAIILGWALPARAVSRILTFRRFDVLTFFILPSLAALAAIRIELFAHFAIWPILVLLILSGDGRWLGAFIGAMTLGGRRGLRTMRLILGSMACGPTQLAVVALAAHLWIMPHEAIYALVIGAAVIEATAPLRRSMARRLTEAEE